MDKLREKSVLKWIIILVIAILVEILCANYSSLRLVNTSHILLAENQSTDESGIFRVPELTVDQKVKNIKVDLTVENSEMAEVYVIIRDQGNKYEYAMPITRVVPQVEETKYINIYPYGEVHTLYMEVRVAEGASAAIHEISLNKPLTFSFKILRGFILFLILVYLNRRRLNLNLEESLNLKNRKQIILILGTCLSMMIIGVFLAKSNPKSVEEPWLHHKQYQELAHVLKEGQVVLNHNVDEDLKYVENPYDTIALQVEGIEYHMDYAYYDGAYYVYFGIIPELLLYLPYHLITGEDLPNYISGVFFYSFLVIGAFFVTSQIILLYRRKIAFIHYLLLSLSICGFSQVIYIAARPDIYHIPIIAANAFTFVGIGFWMAARNKEKKETFYLALGSFFMALVAGCRPQMVLYSLIVVPLFYSFTVKERKLFSRKAWKNTLAFVSPFIIVAIPVCWYNWKRFGSIFEFGATFSLTSNDMNTRGFNLERTWNGVASFLIQTPSTISRFPFLQKTELDIYYMGRNMTEFTFGGLLAANTLTWIILYYLLVEKKKKFTSEFKAMGGILLSSVLVIAVFDANGAGILQRYMGDLIPGLTLTAILCWGYYLDQNSREQRERKRNGTIFVLFFVLNIMYSFLILFAQGDSINIYDNNPVLYHQVESYFRL